LGPFFGKFGIESSGFCLRRHSEDEIKNPAAAGCWISLFLDRDRV